MAEAHPVQLAPEQRQAIARALADPRRFAMLQQVARAGTLTCSALDAHQCISPATISHHLKELATAGLIEARREGQCGHYRVRPGVLDAYLAEVARRLHGQAPALVTG